MISLLEAWYHLIFDLGGGVDKRYGARRRAHSFFNPRSLPLPFLFALPFSFPLTIRFGKMAPHNDDISRRGEGSTSDSPDESIKEKEDVQPTESPGATAEFNETRRESAKRAGSLPNVESEHETHTEDGKKILTAREGYDSLGYSWPAKKKWMLLSSIFAVQVSMNFNSTSIC